VFSSEVTASFPEPYAHVHEPTTRLARSEQRPGPAQEVGGVTTEIADATWHADF